MATSSQAALPRRQRAIYARELKRLLRLACSGLGKPTIGGADDAEGMRLIKLQQLLRRPAGMVLQHDMETRKAEERRRRASDLDSLGWRIGDAPSGCGGRRLARHAPNEGDIATRWQASW
jgi:hypothetical protein